MKHEELRRKVENLTAHLLSDRFNKTDLIAKKIMGYRSRGDRWLVHSLSLKSLAKSVWNPTENETDAFAAARAFAEQRGATIALATTSNWCRAQVRFNPIIGMDEVVCEAEDRSVPMAVSTALIKALAWCEERNYAWP